MEKCDFKLIKQQEFVDDFSFTLSGIQFQIKITGNSALKFSGTIKISENSGIISWQAKNPSAEMIKTETITLDFGTLPELFLTSQTVGGGAKRFKYFLSPLLKKLSNPKELSNIDPFMIFDDCKGHVLLIGNLSLRLTLFDGYLNHNRQCRFVYDFHPALLPPQGKLSGALSVICGNSIEEVENRYAELVKKAMKLTKPTGAPPALASSWHYYALKINATRMSKIMDDMERENLPVEVIQLDAGWYDYIGDFNVDLVKFPKGLTGLTAEIRERGYIAGIWTAGFATAEKSQLAKQHPDWILRHADGTPALLEISQRCYLLDTTKPEVVTWVENFYRSLRDSGFDYFKIDFTRFLILDREVVPSDETANLLDLWVRGFEAVRRGIGNAHLNICGGHIPGGIGLSESARTSSDTYGRWVPDTIRCSLRRSWLNLFQFADPDALNLRICRIPWDPTPHGQLSLGNLTDEEAHTTALCTFVSGGITAVGDPLALVPEYRMNLYHRNFPPNPMASFPANPGATEDECECFYTPLSNEHEQWKILTAFNLTNSELPAVLRLNDDVISGLTGTRFLLCDPEKMCVCAILNRNEVYNAGIIPPHASRLWKLMALPETEGVFFIAADGHFASGREKLTSVELGTAQVCFRRRDSMPNRVCAGKISNGNFEWKSAHFSANSKITEINFLQ